MHGAAGGIGRVEEAWNQAWNRLGRFGSPNPVGLARTPADELLVSPHRRHPCPKSPKQNVLNTQNRRKIGCFAEIGRLDLDENNSL
jgi:hypothetical protein